MIVQIGGRCVCLGYDELAMRCEKYLIEKWEKEKKSISYLTTCLKVASKRAMLCF